VVDLNAERASGPSVRAARMWSTRMITRTGQGRAETCRRSARAYRLASSRPLDHRPDPGCAPAGTQCGAAEPCSASPAPRGRGPSSYAARAGAVRILGPLVLGRARRVSDRRVAGVGVWLTGSRASGVRAVRFDGVVHCEAKGGQRRRRIHEAAMPSVGPMNRRRSHGRGRAGRRARGRVRGCGR